MAVPDKSNKLQQVPVNNVGNGVHHHQPVPDNSFLSGIKQRLLSFIFRGIWKEETDHTLVSHLTMIFIVPSELFYFAYIISFC